MTGAHEKPVGANYLFDPPHWRIDLLRYVSAMILVAATFVVVALGLNQTQQNDEASETESAVIIDLPDAESSANGSSEAPEGPPQEHVDASQSPQPPPVVRPPDEPTQKEQTKEAPAEVLPAPSQPNPAAVLKHKEAQVPTKSAAAPITAAQEEHAPQGVDAPSSASDSGEENRPRPSTHAITLWQKTLMQRLEMAKRALRSGAAGVGSVRIAFAIDTQGAIISEHVVRSSGSAKLDEDASRLVRLAAPFSKPPLNAQAKDLMFVVPVRFR